MDKGFKKHKSGSGFIKKPGTNLFSQKVLSPNFLFL